MATEADFSNRGLSQEDQILARVVVDLGLVKMASVEEAVAKLGQGAGASLGQVLQESGALSPRFLGAVQKAVKSRLRKRGGPGGKRPSTRLVSARPRGEEAARPETASRFQDAERQQVLPSLAIPRQMAPSQPKAKPTAAGTEQTGVPGQAGQSSGPDGQPHLLNDGPSEEVQGSPQKAGERPGGLRAGRKPGGGSASQTGPQTGPQTGTEGQ